MANEAEKAASDQIMGAVYEITKKLCDQKRNANKLTPVKDKQGSLIMITSEKEQEIRWKDYFEEFLNHPEPQNTAILSITFIPGFVMIMD